jgi:hypothetical protein
VTADTAEARKPGRPRRYAEGRRQAAARFTPEQYATLRKAADENRRSVSEEIEQRIDRSFSHDVLLEIRRGLDQLAVEQHQIALELLKEQTQLIANLRARIAELEQERALTEEMIERAIARAFARMGGIG